MGIYQVAFEVAGPAAMFTRPDTGGTPTSYPVPTWSACKGIFESIAFLSDGAAWINPVKVEVCRRVGDLGGQVRFQRYTTNYGGPYRKGDQLRKGTSFQLFATVLTDVCYRLHAVVLGELRSQGDGTNPRHYLKDLFHRRLRQGKCYRTPCLGWSEFTASYWGSFRDGQDGRPHVTELDQDLSLQIPALLRSVFETPVSPFGQGRYAPKSDHDVAVEGGVLLFEPSEAPNAD
jgi:CRISPR-associated protein Cas5d